MSNEQSIFDKAWKALLIISIMVAAVGISASFLIDNPQYILLETQSIGASRANDAVGLTVIVEHYRDNELLSRQEKENDILLENYGTYMLGTFKGLDVDNFNVRRMSDGTSLSFYWAGATRTDNTAIHIGSGNTAPTLDDWDLDTHVAEQDVMQCVYSVSGSQMNVTSAASFGITSSWTVNEVGLSFMIYANSNVDVLMARDVLSSGIAVVAGDVVTVKYVMMIN